MEDDTAFLDIILCENEKFTTHSFIHLVEMEQIYQTEIPSWLDRTKLKLTKKDSDHVILNCF